ncbi:MAG TPA: 4'-phosphopantetheinyl transferase superfamily protein [Streptosporangiaceae bacterium]|nr:4'-phosphopantetheinyl transferase superfamily protein [Streptosporangiaceae bacterium]
MIERILGAGVVAVESLTDPPDVVLFPEEEAVVARAVAKRRREFTTARHCARQGLAKLGYPAMPLLPGERGAPQWPAGVVGSITHCAGYRCAAVARESEVVTVGIDAEPHEPLPGGVLEAVALPAEHARLGALPQSSIHWDRILFAAKESVYKAWFPLTRRWLNFHEADITFDPERGEFDAALLVPGPVVDGRELTGFSGRWLVSDGLALTAIMVTR